MKTLLLVLLLTSNLWAVQKFNRVVAINAGDASTTINSIQIDSSNYLYATVQNTSTSTAAGTLKVQGSNDQVTSGVGTVVNWTDIASRTVAVTAASQTNIDAFLIGFKWMRLVFTNSSGTGALTSTVTLKGF